MTAVAVEEVAATTVVIPLMLCFAARGHTLHCHTHFTVLLTNMHSPHILMGSWPTETKDIYSFNILLTSCNLARIVLFRT